MQIQGKISPIRAPIASSILTCCRETPVKPSFSVPVENTPNNRSVSQNTADLHLTYWLVRPFTSSCFWPHALAHPDPETLPEHQYEAVFFRRSILKLEIRMKSDSSHQKGTGWLPFTLKAQKIYVQSQYFTKTGFEFIEMIQVAPKRLR